MNRDEIREAYDDIASTFANLFKELPEDLVPLAERLLASTGPDGLIADIGCGPGRDIEWFTRRGRRVIGVDISAGMLAKARERSPALVVQGDMRALPLFDQTVDGVWCCAAFLHVTKSEAAGCLAEFARILRPHGLLLLSVQEGDFEGVRHNEALGVEHSSRTTSAKS